MMLNLCLCRWVMLSVILRIKEVIEMSVSMWAWTESKCEQNSMCCCNCDNCSLAYEEEDDE